MKFNFLLLAVLVTVSCKRDEEKTNPTVEDISESVYASGVVRSTHQYQVYSTVSGLIQSIMVHEGDVVRKGDPLMSVLNEPSKLNAYNAKLAADNAALYENQLDEAKIQTDFAFSKMKSDSLLFVRQRNLRSLGVGSLLDLEQRELSYQNSRTNLDVARLHFQDLKRQLELAAKQSKTNLKISNAMAGDYIIRSEVDGKVYKVLKEKGEFASTASPLAVLGDASEFLLEMKVDEYDIIRIKPGQLVLIRMDSYKGETFKAIVEKIEPLMNEQSRTFTVRAVFVTKPPTLYPNLSAEANIVIQRKEKALTIPRNYLIGDSLVRMKNNETKKVVVGIKDYQKAEILKGLKTEDEIYKPIP